MRTTVLVLGISLSLAFSAAADDSGACLVLDDGWRLQSAAKANMDGKALSTSGAVTEEWYPVTVPTTVLAGLVANEVYPDPYFGLNLKSIPGYVEGRWLVVPDDSPFDDPWWYRIEFTAPKGFQAKHITLELDGINYEANVWLNGTRVAGTGEVRGMFRRFSFDVGNLLHFDGPNALAIETISPGQVPDKDYKTKQIEATTGWDDHNPQPPDLNMGIWQPVRLRATGPVRIEHPYVSTDLPLPDLSPARLTVSAFVHNVSDAVQAAQISGRIGDASFERTETLASGEKRLVTFDPSEYPQLVFENPRLWWPHPLGPQHLHDLELNCRVDGEASDTAATRFGIREVSSELNSEDWRQFYVNGRRILIRGGAWMTNEMLLRFTDRRYDALIRYAREADWNMLRSEGFSIRETDAFFDMCDEYGVMVTQQIFGRSIPDEELAIACTEDTILRIRNHPSLVHFLGHDETFPTDTLDEAYRDLIARYTPERTYQPHSGAFLVSRRRKTGGTRTGTRELWTYADPTHYYHRKLDGAWGFAQSGGIGGIVVPYESARRMVPKDQEWPLWSEALSFHTVIQGGEFFDTVVKMLDARYGAPADLPGFCRKAQALNYECARGMYEAYGRNKYSATGITTWKYDAAWPAFMTWAYVDYYLIASGAYYGAKKACEPVHVQYSYDDASVWAVNSLRLPFKRLRVVAEIHNHDGKQVFKQDAVVDLKPDGKHKAFTIKPPEGLTRTHFLRLTLEDSKRRVLSRNTYWLSTVPDIRGKVNPDWREFSVNPKSIANHHDLETLPKVALKASVQFEKASKGARWPETVARVSLENPTPHIAFFVRLAVLKGKEGDEAAPAFWSDNCMTLMPGEKREVEGRVYTRDLGGKMPALRVEGWNLAE